jgi:hypothetical protein
MQDNSSSLRFYEMLLIVLAHVAGIFYLYECVLTLTNVDLLIGQVENL